jgi:hypothetical protein
MRIVEFPHSGARKIEYVNVAIDPSRVALLGAGTVVIGLMTARAEWRVTLSSRDLAALGGVLDQLSKGSP